MGLRKWLIEKLGGVTGEENDGVILSHIAMEKAKNKEITKLRKAESSGKTKYEKQSSVLEVAQSKLSCLRLDMDKVTEIKDDQSSTISLLSDQIVLQTQLRTRALVTDIETAAAMSESSRRGNRSVKIRTEKTINGVPVIAFTSFRVKRKRKAQ
jgi:hypothetical protein